MSDGKKHDPAKAEEGTRPRLSAIPPRQRGWTLTEDQKRREEEILAKERALADGTLLIDGERVKFMSVEEARAVFGASENHVIVSFIPPFKP